MQTPQAHSLWFYLQWYIKLWIDKEIYKLLKNYPTLFEYEINSIEVEL